MIAGGFAWALQRGGLPLTPPPGAVQQLRWWGVPAFALLTALTVFFRTYRWVYLLRPIAANLSAWRVLGIGLVGYSALFFAPLRLGEVVRPYLLSQDGEVLFVEAAGTVAAERIIDGLILVLFTAVALGVSETLLPLPSHVGALPIPVSLVPSTLLVAAAIFSLAFIGMAGLYGLREPVMRLVERLLKPVSPRLAGFASLMIARVTQGFRFLPAWQSCGPFLRDTLCYWVLGALAQWALLWGVGLPATAAVALVTLGVIGLGSLLPAGPGLFGAYQVATYAALAMYFSEPAVLSRGALFVFASYTTHIGISALATGIGFFLISRFPSAAATDLEVRA